MSSKYHERYLNHRCPSCKWRDAMGDQQLRFIEVWANQHGYGFVVECMECGHVNQVTCLFDPARYQVFLSDRVVPTNSIIPF